MAYATHDDMDARFGASNMADLGDPQEIASALDDVSADIDARLAMVYDLPLPAPATQYAFLVAIATDLARRRLYEIDPTEAVLKRAEDAERRLDQLIEGKRELVGSMVGRVSRRQTASERGPETTDGDSPPDRRQDAAGVRRWF